MNQPLTLLLVLLAFSTFAQQDPMQAAQPIIAEGKLLYKSEMASWVGTDLFLENYKNRDNIGGYFSYTNNGQPTCVFFSRTDTPVVIGTITFDSTYNTKTADINLTERRFSQTETDLYEIRKLAYEQINSDTMFKTYKNTNLNLIPLINGTEKKVYVLTGPVKNGVVIFGNDYLLTFDSNHKLTGKKQLHRNIIPIEYGADKYKDMEVTGTVHSHLPETGDYITATDICTLMLYEKYAKWKTHTVVSGKYMNFWDCEKDELLVITQKALDRIDKDQKKRHKK